MHPFAPPSWLENPHVQTIGGSFPLFARPATDVVDEHLRIPIDERYKLHARGWFAQGGTPRKTVILAHGIGGSSISPYMVRAAIAFHRHGFQVVRLDARGAGASVPDAPQLYHGGLTDDLALTIDFLARDARVAELYVLGFSGGANMTLKLAGEWGASPHAKVRAVAGLSPPLDFPHIAPFLDSAARFPYRFHILRGLTASARAFARHHPERARYRADDVRRYGTFRQYDGLVVAPMHGFADVDAYYRAAGAGPYLERIGIPALVVHAEDDPMVPFSALEPWLRKVPSNVEVSVSKKGGHIAWLGGLDDGAWVENWPIRRALAFFAAHGAAAPPA